MSKPKFTILIVCTGNLVRSALAAQLLRARLHEAGSALDVSSAGVGAVSGDTMTEQAEQLSLRYGGDPVGHRARVITDGMVVNADLILTATREQRAYVVTLLPRVARFTFTLKQFARLVRSLDSVAMSEAARFPTLVQAFAELTAAAGGQRGFLAPAADPALDDIEDPFLQSQSVYDRVGVAIDAAVDAVSAAFQRVIVEFASRSSHGA